MEPTLAQERLLPGWEVGPGYDVVEDRQERRGGQSWCVLRLQVVASYAERLAQLAAPPLGPTSTFGRLGYYG